MTEHETRGVSMQGIVIRGASAQDSEAIVALHADRWRRHYRRAFRDS